MAGVAPIRGAADKRGVNKRLEPVDPLIMAIYLPHLQGTAAAAAAVSRRDRRECAPESFGRRIPRASVPEDEPFEGAAGSQAPCQGHDAHVSHLCGKWMDRSVG